MCLFPILCISYSYLFLSFCSLDNAFCTKWPWERAQKSAEIHQRPSVMSEVYVLKCVCVEGYTVPRGWGAQLELFSRGFLAVVRNSNTLWWYCINISCLMSVLAILHYSSCHYVTLLWFLVPPAMQGRFNGGVKQKRWPFRAMLLT